MYVSLNVSKGTAMHIVRNSYYQHEIWNLKL